MGLVAGAVVVLSCLGLMTVMLLEARSLRVTPIAFASRDVPVAFDGLRVAFVSDIHHGPYFSRSRVRTTVRRINALHPDVVVLGGDYVHRDASYIRPVFAELSRLRAPLGVYGVLGNHDHWEGAPETLAAMAAAGILDLDNRGAWLRRDGSRLRLCGVGDLWEDGQDLPDALGGATAGDFVILVTHNPDFVAEIGRAPVDLALAGHTHGGQVTLLGRWAPFVPSRYGQKYRAGLVDEAVPVLVTVGVGSTTPPLRLGAPPEIVLLTLRRG